MFDLENWLVPAFPDKKLVNGVQLGNSFSDPQNKFNHSTRFSGDLSSPPLSSSGDRNSILEYINHLLLEDDDLENRVVLWQDSLALQATEKSLYDVLNEKHSPRPCDMYNGIIHNTIFNGIGDHENLRSNHLQRKFDNIINYPIEGFSFLRCYGEAAYGKVDSLFNSVKVLGSSNGSHVAHVSQISSLPSIGVHENYYHAEIKNDLEDNVYTRKNISHYNGDNGDFSKEDRSNKRLASFGEVTNDEQPDMFDKAVLCPCSEHAFNGEFLSCLHDEKSSSCPKIMVKRDKKPSKTRCDEKEVVDLMALLTQCAQVVSKSDISAAYELLRKIKSHSSPLGDGIERMAHYVGKALEARLAGTGKASDASLLVRRLSPSETLKTYLAYLLSCPFKKMSGFFANKLIWKIAENAPSLHIIDFGIIHGFQWPHLIQHLSSRPGGPPNLRITGVDFPQPGFRPSERTDETGRLLSYYCKRFNVPFEYNAIAKKWDNIKLDDFKILKNEVLIVNCLYRLRYVPDEMVKMDSPTDKVLNLIRKINPDLFIHGIVNGSYNAPFFLTRFRDLLLHFYTAFDMLDSILPREDKGRMLFEREALGSATMSVIACEGANRVIRPETYKQWQVRNSRAGLGQVALDSDIVKDAREKVKLGYHTDFVVDVDNDWMLLGWKGRIFNAISCWKSLK